MNPDAVARRRATSDQTDPSTRSTSHRPQHSADPKGEVRWMQAGRQRERRVPVPEGIAPLELTVAIVAHLVEEYRAVVTDVDVVAADQATVTVRIPAEGTGTQP